MTIDISKSKNTIDVPIQVSGYDKLSAGLVSGILSFGVLTAVLFLIWMFCGNASRDFLSPPLTPWITIAPNATELDQLTVDLTEATTPSLATALESVSDVVSAMHANLGITSGSDTISIGTSFGSRKTGPPPSSLLTPEHKRWVINYESSGINEYASQLTAFAIDIGVVKTNSNDIYRVTNVANSPQIINSSRAREDKSLRFMHQKKRMQRWDQVLCKRAGANIENTILCQFYPESTRAIIRLVEAQALQEAGRELSEVRQTVLKIEPDGSSFKFVVVELLYRL